MSAVRGEQHVALLKHGCSVLTLRWKPAHLSPSYQPVQVQYRLVCVLSLHQTSSRANAKLSGSNRAGLQCVASLQPLCCRHLLLLASWEGYAI